MHILRATLLQQNVCSVTRSVYTIFLKTYLQSLKISPLQYQNAFYAPGLHIYHLLSIIIHTHATTPRVNILFTSCGLNRACTPFYRHHRDTFSVPHDCFVTNNYFAVFDMKTGKVTVLTGYHLIIFNMALTYCMYIYQVCLTVY